MKARSLLPSLLPLAALWLSLAWTATAQPMIPGATAEGLSAALKGTVLIEELNCVACHSAEGTLASRSKTAPRLAEIGKRARPSFIESFIRDPHGTKPGTTMPDVLARLPDGAGDKG